MWPLRLVAERTNARTLPDLWLALARAPDRVERGVSRYQSLALGLGARAKHELLAGLRALGLEPEQAEFAEDRVMLHGSLECAGEPVDIRLPAGALGSVEDFGLVVDEGRWRLVCGEIDQRLLERRLVDPLSQTLALVEARRAAESAALVVDESVEPDGTRRLRLRPRS